MHAIVKRGQSMGRDTQLGIRKDLKLASSSFILLCTMLFLTGRASALPSYARQTSDPFDGASSNWDGSGLHASDNNTLFLLLRAAI